MTLRSESREVIPVPDVAEAIAQVSPLPLELWVAGLDYAGVAVFAASGALAAARQKHDMITFIFFAIITGVGGGTLRDLIIQKPVFWIVNDMYLFVSVVVAVLVYISGPGRWRLDALNWLDAIGLGAYAVIGAAKALAAHVPPVAAVAMGVISATFGGVIRDVIAGEPSALLRREIYVTSALIGALVFVGLSHPSLNLGFWGPALAGFLAGFGLRAGAILWAWTLPGFQARERATPADERD
ncbi:MAG: trimeric intracellular cation channel family protein [Asticcacaulis sp.]